MADAISGIFGKLLPKTEAPKKSSNTKDIIPSVPVGAVVGSPMRQIGKGVRDTILTGADGLTS